MFSSGITMTTNNLYRIRKITDTKESKLVYRNIYTL